MEIYIYILPMSNDVSSTGTAATIFRPLVLAIPSVAATSQNGRFVLAKCWSCKPDPLPIRYADTKSSVVNR